MIFREGNFIALLIIGALVLVAILTTVLVKIIVDKYKKEQSEKAENVIQSAVEKAKMIELEAKDKALKILQDSEIEITRRRISCAKMIASKNVALNLITASSAWKYESRILTNARAR
jgi:uncharacterized membrane protein (DUF106 family)